MAASFVTRTFAVSGRSCWCLIRSWQPFRERLGAEPLEVSLDEFTRRLTGRRARIKALLLDQRVFRGIGNIYADESLWRSQIHPARLAARLTKRTGAAATGHPGCAPRGYPDARFFYFRFCGR